jgi:hypothetical protein
MKKQYKIDRLSYVPSVFGANKRKFLYEKDFIVENSTDFYNVLSKQILINLKEVKKKNFLK